jgi:hypothetical protein
MSRTQTIDGPHNIRYRSPRSATTHFVCDPCTEMPMPTTRRKHGSCCVAVGAHYPDARVFDLGSDARQTVRWHNLR